MEKFLHQEWQKIWAWDITNLLLEIDKFVEGVPETMKVDMWKIRLGVSRRMNSVLDTTTTNRNNSSLSNLNVTDMDTHRTELTYD